MKTFTPKFLLSLIATTVIVAGIAYAAQNVTNTSQSVAPMDTMDAAWFNEVNQKLNEANAKINTLTAAQAAQSGSTFVTTGGTCGLSEIDMRWKGCPEWSYIYRVNNTCGEGSCSDGSISSGNSCRFLNGANPTATDANNCDEFRPVVGGGGGGGGGGCFIAGTQVTLASGETKSIEDIVVGESIKSYDDVTGEVINRPVEQVLHHETKAQELYTFTYGDKTVTSNDIHPMYLPKEQRYVPAAKVYERWLAGETIEFLATSKGIVKVSNIVRSNKDVPVYNLHISGIYDTTENAKMNHNYFANDILVHNIKEVVQEY